MELVMQKDQFTLPEDLRKPSNKHPNCSKTLFYRQEDLDFYEELKDPEWVPDNLKYNIYQDKNFKGNRDIVEQNDRRIL